MILGIPDEELARLFREAAEKAIAETHAAGRPITTMRDGQVVRVYPDGTVVPVEPLELDPPEPYKYIPPTDAEMDALPLEERRRIINEVRANHAHEGLFPDDATQALEDAWIAGTGSFGDIMAAALAKPANKA